MYLPDGVLLRLNSRESVDWLIPTIRAISFLGYLLCSKAKTCDLCSEVSCLYIRNTKIINLRESSKGDSFLYCRYRSSGLRAPAARPTRGVFHRLEPIKNEGFSSTKDFLDSLTEHEIANLFDTLKEQYGRDIFGQGYIYKIIDDAELADVNTLTDDEKENGISTSKNYYVPYDKGDKDGNRWYLETPFAIAWSKENVHFLKTDPKARYQGYTFYFREGFCWIDVNSTYLKARVKSNGVFDVLSMSLFTMTQIPDWYFVSLINAEFLSLYVDNFINNTSHFQINDARQLPIIIPEHETLRRIQKISEESIAIKKACYSSELTNEDTEEKLSKLQKELDNLVFKLYQI